MGKVQIVEDEFGVTNQPALQETELVKRFTFSNENGVSVQVRQIVFMVKAKGRE